MGFFGCQKDECPLLQISCCISGSNYSGVWIHWLDYGDYPCPKMNAISFSKPLHEFHNLICCKILPVCNSMLNILNCLPLLFALQDIVHMELLLTFYILNKLLLSFIQKVTLGVLHNFANSLQVTYTLHSADHFPKATKDCRYLERLKTFLRDLIYQSEHLIAFFPVILLCCCMVIQL